jgi:hypothetical protein
MIGHLPMMPDPSAARRLPEPRSPRLADRQHGTPGRESEAKIALARAVVFELPESGQIELRQIAWSERDGPLLTAEQIARLQHDDDPWYDPENGADFLVQINERET